MVTQLLVARGMPKATQADARYTPAGGRERCGGCRHFMAPSVCNRILGPVTAAGWCRYYSRKPPQRAANFPGMGPPGMSLDLNFMSPGTLDPRITFTRASTATYFNNAGVMQTAAANAPRWDYDPVTHALRGLLIEEARTNIALQSQFAAAWGGANAIILPNSVQSPDGGMAGAAIQEDSTAAAAHLITQSITKAASSITYAISLYVGAGVGTRNIQIQIDDGTNGVYSQINPITGAIIANNSAFGTGFSGSTAVYTTTNNGWGRLSFTVTTSAATTLRAIFFLLNGTSASYNGDGASTVHLYGFQAEPGGFPTSYIPTTAAAVTRAVDLCSIPSSNMSWFTSPGGSWMAEFIYTNPAINGGRVVMVPPGPGSQSPLFILASLQAGQYDTSAVINAANVSVVNTVTRAASTYVSGTGKACLNGGTVASGTMTVGYDNLVGSGVGFMCSSAGGTDNTTGYIRRARYWPRVLSNAEMQSVTI